jgi:hypothetical protein
MARRTLLTIGVDNWEDVKVVLVDKALDFSVATVLGQEVECMILSHLGNSLMLAYLETLEGDLVNITMVPIHSRACTVPWKTTAGLTPLPALPQK